MGFRYKTTYPSDGDILSPSDWVDSMAELAEEWNGGIDRDNIPESAVDGDHIPDGTVAEVTSDTEISGVALPTKTTEWVDGDGTTVIGRVSLTVDVDALIDLSWSGSWNWSGVTFPNNYGGGAVDDEVLAIRLVIDGVEVARSPVHTYRRSYDSTALYANAVVGPGEHTAEVQFRTFSLDGSQRAEETCTVDYSELIAEVLKR